jgi:hypothetical protein
VTRRTASGEQALARFLAPHARRALHVLVLFVLLVAGFDSCRPALRRRLLFSDLLTTRAAPLCALRVAARLDATEEQEGVDNENLRQHAQERVEVLRRARQACRRQNSPAPVGIDVVCACAVLLLLELVPAELVIGVDKRLGKLAESWQLWLGLVVLCVVLVVEVLVREVAALGVLHLLLDALGEPLSLLESDWTALKRRWAGQM